MQGDFVDEVRLRTPRGTLNRFQPSPKTSDNPVWCEKAAEARSVLVESSK